MMYRRNNIFFLALIFVFSTIQGQKIKKHQLLESSVKFEIDNAGITVDGNVNGMEAVIFFDEKKLAQSSFEVTVDPATIKTGIGIRDKHLKNSDYFDVEKYPQIKMVSRKIERKSPGIFEGVFDTTIKDVTRQVILPFTMVKKKDVYTLKSNLVLNRLNYGLGEKSIIMGDEVNIFIEIVTKQ